MGAGGDLVEVNSGGHVMFCFLSGAGGCAHRGRSHPRECEHTSPASQHGTDHQEQQRESASLQHSTSQMPRVGSSRSLAEAFDCAAAGAAGPHAGAADGRPPSAAPRERAAQDTLPEAHSCARGHPLAESTQHGLSKEDVQSLRASSADVQSQWSPCVTGPPRSTEAEASLITMPSPVHAANGRSSPCSSLRGGSRSPSPAGSEHAPERVVIVKVHQARLASQSEQFANELTQHLGICAPACRILRRMVRPFPLFNAFSSFLDARRV
jgi:atypical dual specificity phosphatase